MAQRKESKREVTYRYLWVSLIGKELKSNIELPPDVANQIQSDLKGGKTHGTIPHADALYIWQKQ